MATYNDGSVPFGSQVVSIGGVSFVAESINFQETASVIERRDQTGAPSGQVLVPSFSTGSATLQLASTATVPVTIGATFTLVRNDASTVGCVINQVGEAQTQNDAHKLSINFRKRYAS